MPDNVKSPTAIGNYLLIGMFASLGAVDLLDRERLDAGLWLSLAAALAFLGSESNNWSKIPAWRRGAGLLLVGVSVVLFLIRIATDISN